MVVMGGVAQMVWVGHRRTVVMGLVIDGSVAVLLESARVLTINKVAFIVVLSSPFCHISGLENE